MTGRLAAYLWIGAGALAVSAGAALTGGTGMAHADSTSSTSTASTTSTASASSASSTTHHKHLPTMTSPQAVVSKPLKVKGSRHPATVQRTAAAAPSESPASAMHTALAAQAAAIAAEKKAFVTDLRTTLHGPTSIPHLSESQIYTGTGSVALLDASGTWNHLARDLNSSALHIESAATALSARHLLGPATAPFVGWLHAAANQAELAAAQARSAASQAFAAGSAFESAFSANVPPAHIAANRATLIALTASNIFGLNVPAIAATEALYAEMWARDVRHALHH